MHALPAQVEPGIWQAAGHPVVIEYSQTVLNEIRIAAVEGFTRLSHGGVEIGGILLGTHEDQRVRIFGHRPLPCEYALGPSFTLSPKDERALQALLAAAAAGPRELQPVGWYHSHTRSEICLSEKDLQLFDTYFAEPWQIALVVRPQRFDSPRAGFFFREADGSVHAKSSYAEFTLVPTVSAQRSVLMQTSAPKTPEPRPLPLPLVTVQEPVAPIAPAPPLTPAPPRRAWSKWKLAGGAASAALVAATGFLLSAQRHSAPADLALRAIDVGGQLRIDWNRHAPVLRRAQSGALEIQDGSANLRESLDPAELRTGSLTYVRKSGNVVVRLLLTVPGRGTVDEVTRFIGTPIAIATLTPAPAGAADRAVEDDPPPQRPAASARPARPKRKPLKLPPSSKSAAATVDPFPPPPVIRLSPPPVP